MAQMIKFTINGIDIQVEKDSKSHRDITKAIEVAEESASAEIRTSALTVLYKAVSEAYGGLQEDQMLSMVGQTSYFRFDGKTVNVKDTVPSNRMKIMPRGSRDSSDE